MSPAQFRTLYAALRTIRRQLLSVGDQLNATLSAVDEIGLALHQAQRSRQGEGATSFAEGEDVNLRRN